MYQSAAEAIEASVCQNQIAYASTDAIDDLRVECDDSSETADIMEFWGVDDAGNHWRVHVVLEGMSQ